MTRPLVLLYGFVIFLGAFLLFLIQPVFAKLILPWFGGSAAVWITCLVFFQVALLAGYAYAYAIVRWMTARAQAVVHSLLMLGAMALLPAIPGSHWQPAPGENPLLRLMAILTAVLGAPFFLLATTGPLLQAWMARARLEPYRLFALSNAAALVALVCYPLLIQPRISTRAQDVAWSVGFAVFAMLSTAAAWLAPHDHCKSIRGEGAIVSDSRRSLWTWFALAAGGSMLLLSITNQLTQNVAAVPFLWIWPLAVYLATFILCFESSGWYRPGGYARFAAIAFAAVAYMISDIRMSEAIVVSIAVLVAALFAGCMLCHGELAARKPPKDRLTSFYLMIAAGGAAGAVFIGVLAPVIFSGVYELAVSLLLICTIALVLNWRGAWPERLLWGGLVVTLAIVTGAQVRAYHRNALIVRRDFYGVLRVVDSDGVRRLYHGTIEHGSQFLDAARRVLPTTYYGPSSGAGLALRYCCNVPKHVGIVGLGTGTLAAYGQTGDCFRFYEIDPAVIRLAQSQFSFLKETKATVEIAVGDARLALDREPSQHFDVLAIDAFSGDAIPVHLLTTEAFAIYRRHLKASGILAVHVSNQFLDLAPVVAQLAAGQGMRSIAVQSDADDTAHLAAATWVLAARDTALLDRAEIARTARAIPRRSKPAWTDDYNNLLEVLR